MRAVLAVMYVAVLLAATALILSQTPRVPPDTTGKAAAEVSQALQRGGLVRIYLPDGLRLVCNSRGVFVADEYGREARVDVGGRRVVGGNAFTAGLVAVNDTAVNCAP